MATVTVLYPTKEGATFDMDYYLQKHMPLVQARWGPFGLSQWLVTDLRQTAGSPYAVQATLVWDTGLEGFKKAGEEHGPEVMGDVPKFSSEQPIMLTGVVVGKQK